MPLNFTSTLDKTATDIPKPPLQPVGTYRWMVEKHPEITEKFKDTWDIITYTCKCIGAQGDVDPDALHEFGPLDNVRQRVTFFFSNSDEAEFSRSEYQHKRFLERDLKAMTDGASIKEGMANATNKVFLGAIKWKADKDNPENFNANIGRTLPDE